MGGHEWADSRVETVHHMEVVWEVFSWEEGEESEEGKKSEEGEEGENNVNKR